MDLENFVQHSLLSKLRGPLAFKRNASTSASKKNCQGFSSVKICHQQWKEMKYRKIFFPCRTKNNRTLLPITMWLTALRLLAMTEITVTLMRMSASSPCCRPSLKRVLLESTRGAQRKVSVSPLIYKTGCELIL